MRLTLSVIYHHLLKTHTNVIEVLEADTKVGLDRIHLWNHSVVSSTVFLAKWADLRHSLDIPPNIICIGGGKTAAQVFVDADTNALIFDESTDMASLLQEISDIFLTYANYESEIQSAIIREDGLDAVLDIVSKIFDNPVFVTDAAFRILGNSSVGPNHREATHLTDSLSDGISDPHVMAVLDESGLVDKLNVATEAVYVNLPTLEPYFVTNIMVEDVRIASITVLGDRNELDLRLLPLLDIIRDMIQISILKAGNPYYLQSSNLLKMILDMLGGALLDKRVLQHSLSAVRWNITDEYQLLKIELDKASVTGGTGKYTQELVKNIFPDSIIVDFQDAFITIIHRTGRNDTDALIDGKLRELMESRRCKAGVSMRYYDFSLLASSYILAGVALEKGSVLERNKSLYHYEDYVVAHLIDLCAISIDVVSLCHPEAIKLFHYDEAHNSEFFASLHIYLTEEKHLATAAKKLSIHRNTLVYRLSRIQDICSIDLNNSGVRLHLMWSYQVLRHLHPKTTGDDGEMVWTGYT